MTTWLEKHQVSLYFLGILCGALAGNLAPGGWYAHLITPALIGLLYATFLAVPLTDIRCGASNPAFLTAALLLNFIVVPVLVFALTRFIPLHDDFRAGVLLVLLAPCIDYVIVFTRLAGGNVVALLAATPLLMALQILLLPAYLMLLGGNTTTLDWMPFVQAFVIFIALPLGLSICTQLLGREVVPGRKATAARRVTAAMETLMVPLMMLTLFAVAASHIHHVRAAFASLVQVALIYVLFLLLMPMIGYFVGRAFRQNRSTQIALAFTAVTRNSLVVLPLAMSAIGEVAALVVVTQTLVELLGMVILVRVFRASG